MDDGLFIDSRTPYYGGGGGGGQTDILQVLGTILGMVEDKKAKKFMNTPQGMAAMQEFVKSGATTPELVGFMSNPRVGGTLRSMMGGAGERARISESQARTAEANQKMDERDWVQATTGLSPMELDMLFQQGTLASDRERNRLTGEQIKVGREGNRLQAKAQAEATQQRASEAFMQMIAPLLQGQAFSSEGGGGNILNSLIKGATNVGGPLAQMFEPFTSDIAAREAERQKVLGSLGKQKAKDKGPAKAPSIGSASFIGPTQPPSLSRQGLIGVGQQFDWGFNPRTNPLIMPLYGTEPYNRMVKWIQEFLFGKEEK